MNKKFELTVLRSNDNQDFVIAKILYQTAEAVKVYIPREDTEIWVPVQYVPNRSELYSGREVELALEPAWLN